MASALADKILRLASRSSPEQIYTYNVGRLVKYGSWCLALTFVTYGQTFADWSLSSTLAMYKQEREEAKDDKTPWYRSPEIRFAGRTTGSVLLSAIPITLSLCVLYLTSRVVTKINYIPGKPAQCQFTRRSIFGRNIIERVPLKDIRLRQKKRIFTGNGLHGIDDKATLAFFVTDSRKSLRRGLYIVNRSGSVKDKDGRILDIILGGSSVEGYEKNHNASDIVRKDPQHASSVLEETAQRAKMQGINTRNIVLNKK